MEKGLTDQNLGPTLQSHNKSKKTSSIIEVVGEKFNKVSAEHAQWSAVRNKPHTAYDVEQAESTPQMLTLREQEQPLLARKQAYSASKHTSKQEGEAIRKHG